MFFSATLALGAASFSDFAIPQDAANMVNAIEAMILETDFMMNSLFSFKPCDEIAALPVT
jgi:hypothetical protein